MTEITTATKPLVETTAKRNSKGPVIIVENLVTRKQIVTGKWQILKMGKQTMRLWQHAFQMELNFCYGARKPEARLSQQSHTSSCCNQPFGLQHSCHNGYDPTCKGDGRNEEISKDC